MNEYAEQDVSYKKNILLYLGIFFCITAFIFLWVLYIVIPEKNTPSDAFPSNADITIAEGLTQSEIADYLTQKQVIRSSLYFYIYIKQHYPTAFIKAGTYRFSTPRTMSEVIDALVHGTNLSPLTKVTFPEGFSVKNIGNILGHTVSKAEMTQLLSLEGYLFPDTYFISKDMPLSDILVLMQKTFAEKIMPYEERIHKSKFSKDEIIVLASLIEREAKDEESMKMVSAVLQNRLAIKMPLQVDAVFDYILDKTSDQLTAEDLTIDSAYNTYTHTGLPPSPIANPGILSIEAVLYPATSTDLYYLTGSDGTFYYAKTFDEHKKNKERYLQ